MTQSSANDDDDDDEPALFEQPACLLQTDRFAKVHRELTGGCA